MMKQQLKQINRLLIGKFGIPKRNIRNSNPVDALVATILSQNTNDYNSYKAYKNLRNNFDNWETVAGAKLVAIEKNIRVGGLAKQKARAIKTILSELKDTRGKISLAYINDLSTEQAIAELTKYKGVGVKTASCVLLFSLGRNVCPVDTHVHRVLNRIGVLKTNSPDKTFQLIYQSLPDGIAHSLHTNLIMLGRHNCKAQSPQCKDCPLIKLCKYDEKFVQSKSKIKRNDFLLLDNV